MKLTRASTYALAAVAYMSAQKGRNPIASHIIAQDRGIPERFLLKVLKPLVSAQVLISIKGPNGGYQLAKNPNEITMLEIVESVDGAIRGQAPTHGQDSHIAKRLDHICMQAAEALRKQLAKVKMTELASKD